MLIGTNATVNLTDEDYTVYCFANDINVYLPALANANKGRIYVIKSNGDSVKVKVNQGSGDYIDGSYTEITLNVHDSAILQSDGNYTWLIIGRYTTP